MDNIGGVCKQLKACGPAETAGKNLAASRERNQGATSCFSRRSQNGSPGVEYVEAWADAEGNPVLAKSARSQECAWHVVGCYLLGFAFVIIAFCRSHNFSF